MSRWSHEYASERSRVGGDGKGQLNSLVRMEHFPLSRSRLSGSHSSPHLLSPWECADFKANSSVLKQSDYSLVLLRILGAEDRTRGLAHALQALPPLGTKPCLRQCFYKLVLIAHPFEPQRLQGGISPDLIYR